MAEAERALLESKAEEQAEKKWSEAFQHQLAAKKQRQLLEKRVVDLIFGCFRSFLQGLLST